MAVSISILLCVLQACRLTITTTRSRDVYSVISGQNPYHPSRSTGNTNRWLDDNVWGCLNGALPPLVLKPGTSTYSGTTLYDKYSYYTPANGANAVDSYSYDSSQTSIVGVQSGDPYAHTCHHWVSSATMNWAVYEREAQCNVEIKFTLKSGNTVVLEDGCSGNGFGTLYPAVIGPVTFTDSADPVPKVNGNSLPYTIEVEAASLDASGETVNYAISADDDCDASPTVAVHQGLASGSTFPVGDSAVTIRATDNQGNTVDGTLTVRVTLPPDSDNDGLSDNEEAGLGTGKCCL